MANHKSAIKRIRSDERKRIRNRLVRNTTRTFVKKAASTVAAGDADDARKATLDAIKALDMAASKGVLHKNTVARRKSRLMAKLNKLG